MDNISVYYTHTFYMYKSRFEMRHRGAKEYASVAAPWASSALPAVLPSTMPSVGLGGRPCAFPELLSSFWDPAAVEICPAAAAADQRGSPRQSDRPARRQRRQMPRLWPPPRWW